MHDEGWNRLLLAMGKLLSLAVGKRLSLAVGKQLSLAAGMQLVVALKDKAKLVLAVLVGCSIPAEELTKGFAKVPVKVLAGLAKVDFALVEVFDVTVQLAILARAVGEVAVHTVLIAEGLTFQKI